MQIKKRRNPEKLRPPLLNRLQNIRNDLSLRLCAEVAFAVEANGNVASFHVARADDEHGVHFRLLGPLNLAVDLVGAEVAFGANHVGAELGYNALRIVHQRFIVADGEDADMLGREPEREVAGVMIDEEADEAI